jgi:hypothetical protein
MEHAPTIGALCGGRLAKAKGVRYGPPTTKLKGDSGGRGGGSGGSRDRGGLRALAGCPMCAECLPGLKFTTANLRSCQLNVFARLEVLLLRFCVCRRFSVLGLHISVFWPPLKFPNPRNVSPVESQVLTKVRYLLISLTQPVVPSVL